MRHLKTKNSSRLGRKCCFIWGQVRHATKKRWRQKTWITVVNSWRKICFCGKKNRRPLSYSNGCVGLNFCVIKKQKTVPDSEESAGSYKAKSDMRQKSVDVQKRELSSWRHGGKCILFATFFLIFFTCRRLVYLFNEIFILKKIMNR